MQWLPVSSYNSQSRDTRQKATNDLPTPTPVLLVDVSASHGASLTLSSGHCPPVQFYLRENEPNHMDKVIH